MESREFIIGRASSSPVKVPPDREGVSMKHIRITISESGVWTLEDLESANGTSVRDEDGEFKRVFKKQISESDVIRIGPAGAYGFMFTARRVIYPDSSYQYEFKQLKATLRRFKEEEKKKEDRMEINGGISKCAGMGVVAVVTLLDKITPIEIDPNTRYMLIAAAPILMGFFFKGQNKALKALRMRRQKVMLCPSCGKPISEFDIQEGQCSRCKAK